MKQKYSKLTLGSLLTSALLSMASPQLMAGANIVFVNLDGVNEGFNDLTTVLPVTGNAGTTLGEQRQNVFRAAMQVWGDTLNSTVDIRVGANFDPQFCTASSAVLGSAGPETAHRDFAGATPNTWYGQALANSIAGIDLATASNDIGATFNSDLDLGCFNGGSWDYQIPSAGSSLSLYSVVLHELAHGLNFLSFVDGANGTFFNGSPDIYTTFLLDQGTNKSWLGMTDAERAASAIGGNLFWTGGNAKTAATGIPLTTGQDGATQNIKMYAPNPLQTGSSVSHWDTALSPDELMEPISTANPLLAATTGAFQDMGWGLASTPQADVSVTQTASANPVTAGNTFTYTITVQNAGPDAATNVVVNDILPTCVSFLSTTGGCTEDPNGVPTCTLGDFPASTLDSYDILVDTTGCPVGSITNQASVGSDTSDPDVSNNDAALSINIEAAPLPPQADLSISQVDSIDPAIAGSNITYTITVNNAGPDTAAVVQVNDVLPAGTTFVSSTGCNNDPAGIPTCDLNDIAANASAQFAVTVSIDIGTSGVITNTASVSSATDDPNLMDNQVSENTTVNTPPPSDADLSITMIDSTDPVVAGSELIYTVTVNNAGPATATAVQVSNALPANVTLISTAGCNEDPSGVPTCNIGDINAGASAQFTMTVTIDPAYSGTLTSSASVTSITTDSNIGNNNVSENTTVSALGDIDLDGCIGRADITQLITGLRANSATPAWDFNGDGQVSRADARSLVQLYTNPNGVCP